MTPERRSQGRGRGRGWRSGGKSMGSGLGVAQWSEVDGFCFEEGCVCVGGANG